MKLLFKLLAYIAANIAGLIAAAYWVPGFTISVQTAHIAIVAALLMAGNIVVKPLLKLFLAPLVMLTLGLFTIVINAIILASIDFLSPYLMIEGIGALLWGTLIISTVGIIARLGVKLFSRETTYL